MSSRNGFYSEERAEAMGRSLFHIDADGRITRRFRIPNHMQIVRALWGQRPAELLPKLECPILLLPARQSSDSSDIASSKAAAMKRALELQPKARVRWFDNTIHDVPLQRPDDLAAELVTFAEEALQTGARS
jgi:pimeloyl-ACP methyl ester carboxylesterase